MDRRKSREKRMEWVGGKQIGAGSGLGRRDV